MLIVDLAVNPLRSRRGNASPDKSHGEIVRAVEIIAQSGLNFEIGPMGTCIEGEFLEVMHVIERCLLEMSRESSELLFTIRGDFQSGREKRLEKRIEKVVDEVLAKAPDSPTSAETLQ